VTDTRYFATSAVVASQNFYGEPRAFLVSVRGSY
jgi:hypothetical protein